MAIVKLSQRLEAAARGEGDASGTVGNNRTLSIRNSGDFQHWEGRLHGHKVFSASIERKPESQLFHVIADNCAYRTTTTREAIKDFGALFFSEVLPRRATYAGNTAPHASLGVSFAKNGKPDQGFDVSLFWAWDGKEWKSVHLNEARGETRYAARFSGLIQGGTLHNVGAHWER